MDARDGFLYFSNMQRHGSSIPVYDLYGEAGDLPDILHCESIRVRAALHDWNIEPHRHARLHQFLLVRSGGGEAEIDGRRFPLEPGLLLNLPPGHIHAFRFEAATDGWVVTAPVETLEQGPAAAFRAALAQPGAAKAGTEAAAVFAMLAAEHAGAGAGRLHMLAAGFALLAGHAARALERETSPAQDAGGLMRRFAALVEAGFRKHVPVANYATELGVSPTHLSRIVRAAAGVPASRYIETRLMREARRELAYTNINVQQIAFGLGYEDPAYFSRVFSRATGSSPLAYRRRVAGPQPASTRPDASE